MVASEFGRDPTPLSEQRNSINVFRPSAPTHPKLSDPIFIHHVESAVESNSDTPLPSLRHLGAQQRTEPV